MGEIIELIEKRDSTQNEIRKNKDQLRELRVGGFKTYVNLVLMSVL